MGDELNGRQPQWKTTLTEGDLNVQYRELPLWCTTLIKDFFNDRQP